MMYMNAIAIVFFADEYDHPHECPGYETKQSDGEVPVMLELWGMSFIPIAPRSILVRMVVLDCILSKGLIELNCVLMLN